ncbi:MAG: T9SS type A sorting domain-containing protein [bacterium]|nr:T9SS type A sorting domain-containing protein [bacterium]
MKNWICTLLFAVGIQSLFAQPSTLWQRTYGGSGNEDGTVIEPTLDGGFIIGGFTQSIGSGATGMLLLKIDTDGDSLWSRAYGGAGDEFCYGIAIDLDGYLLCGTTASFGAGGEDILLIKVNSVGDSLWSRTYGGSGNDRGNIILSTADGGFVIGTEGSMSILRVDVNGDSLWSLSLDGVANALTATSDGNFVAAGYQGAAWPGDADMWMCKFTTGGDVLWNHTYNDCGDQCRDVEEIAGGFALFGYSKIACGPEEYWLIKTNSDGECIESHSYGGSSYDYCNGGLAATDGGYLLTGYTWSFGNGLRDVWLTKADAAGNLLWSQTYGGSDDEGSWDVKELPGREYVIVGYTRSSGHGGSDVYVIRIGQDDSILPVELLSFEATPGDQHVTLHWATASESSLSHFEIARDDVSVAQVPASNTSSGQQYQWEDRGLENDVVYSYTLTSVDINGSRALLGTVSVTPSENPLPSEFTLHQNYPNPFNAATTITFTIPEQLQVSLAVYNVLGENIATLIASQLPAGLHTVAFDASKLSSGIYFYKLASGNISMQRKMILIK